MSKPYEVEVAIIGGGIAGLWILARLRLYGFKAVLFERGALGVEQTLASQGMIHGGQKYKTEDIKSAIASMPAVWDACLEGSGEIDLRSAKVLAPYQIMWSSSKFVGNLLSFLASKFTEGHTKRINNADDYPKLFREMTGFTGRLYHLDEKVLDVKSVLEVFQRTHSGQIYRAEVLSVQRTGERLASLELSAGDESIRLIARQFIFCAGKGNEWIAQQLGLKSQVAQRRPLKQVLVKGLSYDLYGHCIGANADTPRVTITAHPQRDGKYIWYLGGGVAERGAGMDDLEAITNAFHELRSIFPFIGWEDLEWATHTVDRAERYLDGRRPPGPQMLERENAIFAWPTKMTFAPMLANHVTESLQIAGVRPAQADVSLPLPKVSLGRYPWELPLNWGKVKT